MVIGYSLALRRIRHAQGSGSVGVQAEEVDYLCRGRRDGRGVMGRSLGLLQLLRDRFEFAAVDQMLVW